MDRPSTSEFPSTGRSSPSDDSVVRTGERKQIRRKKRKTTKSPILMNTPTKTKENDAIDALLLLVGSSDAESSHSSPDPSASQSIPPSKSSPPDTSTPSTIPPSATVPNPHPKLPLKPSPPIKSTLSSLPPSTTAPPSKSNALLKSVPPVKPAFTIIPPTVVVPSSQQVKKTRTVKGTTQALPLEKQEEGQSSSPSQPIDSDLKEEYIRLMSYVSPPGSMGELKLTKLKEKMKSGRQEDINKYEMEKMMQEMLHYALHKWPATKFPIGKKFPSPFDKMKRNTDVYGECTLEKLTTLWNNKSAKERKQAEQSTSFPPSTSRIPSRTDKSASPVEKELPLEDEIVDVTGDVSIVPPESTEKQPSETEVFPAEDAPISPIESPERQVLRSRGSSEESERKRKISEESSEGEPESKRTEKDSIPSGGAHLSELTEADETRNDGMEMDERSIRMDEGMETIPPFIQTSTAINPSMIPNIPTPTSASMMVDSTDHQPIPVEMITDHASSIVISEDEVVDSDECMIVDELHNSTHIFSRNMDDDMDHKEGVKESTGQVVGFITMGPVVVSVPSSPTGEAQTNEFEAPDFNDLNYLLPNRAASSMTNDDKDDKALVAAREELDRQRIGISSEDGRELNYIPGTRRRTYLPLGGNYKLLVYILKSRYDDDLLPSQRHLRNFADIIQNKLVSKLREEDANEWSHQFYKVVRSDIITQTLFHPLPNSFEKDLLLLKPSEQFDQWRNGRAYTAELLELAVKAESTPFKSLIEETLRLKDSFTIVRARTLFRKLLTDLSSTFDDLKRGNEDESDDFKEIEKEATEKVKEIFIFSFFVISHSISINNRSRTALKPYELLRVMAYVLEGWTGWLERGGIFRLFVAVCDKKEKEGGYIPLGRGKAIQMRNRIESRVSRICRQIRLIEDEGEERAVIYMLHQLKDKDILLASARDFKDNNKEGRHIACEHNLGNAKTKASCILRFKNEEEKQAHKNVAHLWRDRDNKAATKCSKCVRYFLMESSLALHQLVAHHDYDDDEEEEEERGSDGGSSPRDQGDQGEEDDESDRKKIGRLSLKMKNQFKLAIAQWFPEEVQVKQEEESPSKNNTPMEE